MGEKRIEVIEMRAGDIKTGFGNPRKISKKKREELQRSLEMFGDFGVFILDQDDNVIAGNQRLDIIKSQNPDTILCCKKLYGYTEAELKAINIKDNTHSGEWDLELLADWTADITLDLGIETKDENPNEREIQDLELIRYEKYDYVLIACRTEIDYNDLVRKLGIEGKKVKIAGKRRIKARAVWYDEMKAQLVEKSEVSNLVKEDRNDKVVENDELIGEEEQA